MDSEKRIKYLERKLKKVNQHRMHAEDLKDKQYELLMQYITEASSQNQKVSTLARQVAHDLRSPLGVFDILLPKLQNLPLEHQQLLEKAVARMKTIVNNLLEWNDHESLVNLSNFNSDKVKPPTHLFDAIAEVLDEKTIQFEGSHVQLTIEDKGLGYGAFAMVDKGEIKRAISNLIDNAFHSFVSPESSSLNPKITIKLTIVSGRIKILVADNGCGMTDDTLKRLGELNFTTKRDGNGLGVHQVFQMIKSFNGKINYSSKLGRGTQVNLEFILARAPSWFCRRIYFRKDKRILVFDDEPHFLPSVKSTFEPYASQIIGAKDFYELMKGDNEDLYLIDFNLKHMNNNSNGLMVAKSLREKGANNVVVCTSQYDDENLQQACASNGFYLLNKASLEYIPKEIIELTEDEGK